MAEMTMISMAVWFSRKVLGVTHFYGIGRIIWRKAPWRKGLWR